MGSYKTPLFDGKTAQNSCYTSQLIARRCLRKYGHNSPLVFGVGFAMGRPMAQVTRDISRTQWRRNVVTGGSKDMSGSIILRAYPVDIVVLRQRPNLGLIVILRFFAF